MAKWYNGKVGVLISLRGPVRRLLHVGRRFWYRKEKFLMKPKLAYEEQIEHLAAKGVCFNKMSKADALRYLRCNSYLFKLSSYRKNYPKDITGKRYIHLDFSTLVDLAVIDMYLRALVLKMALNVEHYSKVKLLRRITEDPAEDGYSIVTDYLNSLPSSHRDYINKELSRNANSPYCSQAYDKYKDAFPVWVFIEIISFGSFISFYRYCANRLLARDTERYNSERLQQSPGIFSSKNEKARMLRKMVKDDKMLESNFFLLLTIKRLRNASAHNNCIINDLRDKDPNIYQHADTRMIKEIRAAGLTTLTIRNKLSNERICKIISCLYAHKHIVSSHGVNEHLARELHEFSDRLFKHHDYRENLVLRSTFDVIVKIIDKWFPIV